MVNALSNDSQEGKLDDKKGPGLSRALRMSLYVLLIVLVWAPRIFASQCSNG